ncbi:response regulator [Defluviitalea saccharophila]|uniref:Stage 0 sporulation protein A homolog n=1 Tax=Defluviitalea saccharophila TaxID=879970 RepID=A0ABZ2Y8Z7_9FIRM
MQLYKILLVDDEEEIRKGIIKKIKWEELGFVVVGEAENGIEALDIIDKTMPDVVITDIRMPFMDGIKLAENIKYRFPTNKVIVLSGFDDFEYAQEAIKLGVIRYILKPINSIEFTELLKEVKHLLDEEIRSKNDLETLKINYQKSLPLLKERFLNHWIEDYVAEEEIEENIHILDLDIAQKHLALAVIRPDELGKEEKDIKTLKNKHLLKMAIFNICEEVVKEHNLGTIFMKINEMVVIIPLKVHETVKSSSRIAVALEQIRIAVQKYLETTVTIGVGNICTNKSMLYKTYASALAALDYTIMLGSNKIIYIDDIEPAQNDINFEEGDERELLGAIRVGQKEKIEEAVSRVLAKVEETQVSLSDYQIYIVEVFSSIMRLIKNMDLDINKIFPDNVNFFTIINGFRSKKEVKEWLLEVCFKVTEEFSLKRSSSKSDIIERAQKYIDSNYWDDELNAEKLCNYLHISTNYFSALFKKETKLNFTSYLTKVRIEKAKELLRNTDMKAFDIGNKVGYTEGHYFSYVFKKITGLTPTEYRNGKA